MGLDLPSVQLLCCAKNIGVDFSDSLMIGRQEILCEPQEAKKTFNAAGIERPWTEEIRRGQFGDTAIFATYPNQSNYSKSWQRAKSGKAPERAPNPKQGLLRRALPTRLKKAMRGVLAAMKGSALGFLQPYYQNIDLEDLLRGRLQDHLAKRRPL
jgi:hypothetical protein